MLEQSARVLTIWMLPKIRQSIPNDRLPRSTSDQLRSMLNAGELKKRAAFEPDLGVLRSLVLSPAV